MGNAAAHPTPELVVGLEGLGIYAKPAVHRPPAHLEALHVWLMDQRLCFGRTPAAIRVEWQVANDPRPEVP